MDAPSACHPATHATPPLPHLRCRHWPAGGARWPPATPLTDPPCLLPPTPLPASLLPIGPPRPIAIAPQHRARSVAAPALCHRHLEMMRGVPALDPLPPPLLALCLAAARRLSLLHRLSSGSSLHHCRFGSSLRVAASGAIARRGGPSPSYTPTVVRLLFLLQRKKLGSVGVE
ncbi:hypothetical protein ACP4OV_006239 [Aristida adscensionis]